MLIINDKSIQLSTLKLISNISVYPPARRQMRGNSFCLSNIRYLKENNGSLFQKHAEIAENAVLWEA
jgi:hypothetical protein